MPKSTELIIYEEKAPLSKIISLVLVLGLVSLTIFLLFSPSKAKPMLIFGILIYIIACWGYFDMKFKVTSKAVEASFPPFTYSIPFNEIEDIEIGSLPWYIGWGLRIWKRRIAFVGKHGPARIIKKKTGIFRKVILVTENPKKFINIITEKWHRVASF